MWISDWSSDEGSSDLLSTRPGQPESPWDQSPGTTFGIKIATHPHDIGQLAAKHDVERTRSGKGGVTCLDPGVATLGFGKDDPQRLVDKIGRASCRERVCPYV